MRIFLTLLVTLAALMGWSQAMAPHQTSGQDKKELAMLALLEKKQVSAKAAYTKAPKKTDLKKAYVDATMKLADAVLISPALGPKVKYPKSLHLYRDVYKVDPSNKKAKENIDLIEGIYKSMGRPIPPQ